jgi:hypothetical protein
MPADVVDYEMERPAGESDDNSRLAKQCMARYSLRRCGDAEQ